MAGKKMAKVGKGKQGAFDNSGRTSNSAPRAKGPAGKGGNWRAGVPMHSVGGQGSAGRQDTGHAVQGSSTANMGDGSLANGHNVPRGYFATKNVARGAAAGSGSTPLAHTGTNKAGKGKRKYNPASQVSGPNF
jgi:hypothetical protein